MFAMEGKLKQSPQALSWGSETLLGGRLFIVDLLWPAPSRICLWQLRIVEVLFSAIHCALSIVARLQSNVACT